MIKQETVTKYLKVIFRLREQCGEVKSVMIAAEMHVSRPTVCVALQQLEKEGMITFDDNREVRLTAAGEAIAQKVNKRYQYFYELFTGFGLPQRIADKDACVLEYALSDECYAVLRSKTWRK